MSVTLAPTPASRYDPWPKERVGFEDTQVTCHAKTPPTLDLRSNRWVGAEQRLGRLLAMGSVGWSGWLALNQAGGLFSEEMVLRQPLELGTLGLLFWLHGRRRARQH